MHESLYTCIHVCHAGFSGGVWGPVFMVTLLLLAVVVAVQENARREMEVEIVRE